MKWKKKARTLYYIVDFPKYKIVKKFLLFPRCLQNECRWLESVFILQKRVEVIDMYRTISWDSPWRYNDIRFEDSGVLSETHVDANIKWRKGKPVK